MMPMLFLLTMLAPGTAQAQDAPPGEADEAPPAPLPPEAQELLDGFADLVLEAASLPAQPDIRWKEPRIDLRQTNANLEEVYRQHRLVILERDDAPWGFGGATWKVRTGDGRVIGTRGFAQRVGDEEMLARLDKELATARWLPVGLAAGGVGLIGGGVGLVVNASSAAEKHVEPNWPDPENYVSEEAYQLAVEQAEADYQYALDIFVENRRWTAGVLSVTGVTLLASAPLVAPGIQWRQHYPALYYDRDTAERLANRYNLKLRKELGLDLDARGVGLDEDDYPEEFELDLPDDEEGSAAPDEPVASPDGTEPPDEPAPEPPAQGEQAPAEGGEG